MLRQLADQHRWEQSHLAPYAIHNTATLGRKYHEESHFFRTDFQRDRDRILHSRSFRRLEYKTQVFLNGTGDHLRTRLTHTIEVAAIARTIAKALCMNEDLAETIAFAHDLGHTPFGHAGEETMNQLLKDHGGFDHNSQALKVVDTLEQKYPDFDGLNLTWEVRTGLVKHRDSHKKLDNVQLPPINSLESQVADLADDLAYYGHDVDDGLEAELIDEDMLNDIEIWRLAAKRANPQKVRINKEKCRAYTVRCLIDMMVENSILNTNRILEEKNILSPQQAQQEPEKIVSFTAEFERMTADLRNFLYHNVYHHPQIEHVNREAVERMHCLFQAYIKNPNLLGRITKARIEKDGLYRAAADYIAGMTDRFAFLEFKRCCE